MFRAPRTCVVVFAVACTLFASGCKKRSAASAPDGERLLQARFDGDPDEQPRVSFVIDNVHRRRSPSASAPWHVQGGDWIFFDAHTVGAGASGVRFGFGERVERVESEAEQAPFSFAKVMLTVPDAEDGEKLATVFARIFQGRNPPRPEVRRSLAITPVSAAVLARDRRRLGNGGFSGRGTWTAAKLFLQRPGIEAEVFFNFDLESRRGEFAEKDGAYADDLVAFVASELRDGPLPPRTPETDPQIASVGPKLEAWRAIGPPGAQALRFEGAGKRILYTQREGAALLLGSIAVEQESGDALPAPFLRVAQHFGGLVCAPSDDPCLLTETQPKSPNLLSSDDPHVYTLVERAKKTTLILEGPWTDGGFAASAAISPDGAVVAFVKPTDGDGGTARGALVHFVPSASSDKPLAVPFTDPAVDVIAWTGAGPSLRAVVRVGASFSDDAKKVTWALVEPRTGARRIVAALPSDVHADARISPDGKRRVSCKGAEEIVVTTFATREEKRFVVHPEDRRAFGRDCTSWTNARYLSFDTARRGIIDVDTMKLSYLDPRASDPHTTRAYFNADFTWAVSTTTEGMRVARVVVR